jgi:hypothetical protein
MYSGVLYGGLSISSPCEKEESLRLMAAMVEKQ